MLILTRRVGEALHIGEQVVVKVLSVRGGQVRLGIDAPREVKVNRDEVVNPRNKQRDRRKDEAQPDDMPSEELPAPEPADSAVEEEGMPIESVQDDADADADSKQVEGEESEGSGYEIK